jgi:hypothetical protein
VLVAGAIWDPCLKMSACVAKVFHGPEVAQMAAACDYTLDKVSSESSGAH